MLVQRSDAILADGPSTGEPRVLTRALERNHFDLHNFEEDDPLFQTVEHVLKDIIPNHFLLTSAFDDTLSSLTPDDEGNQSFDNQGLYR